MVDFFLVFDAPFFFLALMLFTKEFFTPSLFFLVLLFFATGFFFEAVFFGAAFFLAAFAMSFFTIATMNMPDGICWRGLGRVVSEVEQMKTDKHSGARTKVADVKNGQ